MARLRTKTISRRTVEALEVEKDTVFWDSELSGFGVRVYPSGSKVYVVQTRAGGKPAKRVTVGRHGVIGAAEARRRAALIVARIKVGEEAVAEPLSAKRIEGPTVAALARRWLEDHVAVRCKPKSAETYRRVVGRHIEPALGAMPALAVGHGDVTELHQSLRDTPVMANRTVDVLSRIYNAAADRGLIPQATIRAGWWRRTVSAGVSASSPTRSCGAWAGCWTKRRPARSSRRMRWRRSGCCC